MALYSSVLVQQIEITKPSELSDLGFTFFQAIGLSRSLAEVLEILDRLAESEYMDLSLNEYIFLYNECADQYNRLKDYFGGLE